MAAKVSAEITWTTSLTRKLSQQHFGILCVFSHCFAYLAYHVCNSLHFSIELNVAWATELGFDEPLSLPEFHSALLPALKADNNMV